MTLPRIVCRFSCGAASAVATKLILEEYPRERVLILNAFIKEEHEDNRRFLADCQEWFQHPIVVRQDMLYSASTLELFRKKRFLANGMYGAPCSKALKRDVLDVESFHDDIFVLGYTIEEEKRVGRFMDANNGRKIICPLVDRKLTKAACLSIIQRAGIELPLLYRMGYNNANCIGCVKGGEGYFNKIRRDFPERFYPDRGHSRVHRPRSLPISQSAYRGAVFTQGFAA